MGHNGPLDGTDRASSADVGGYARTAALHVPVRHVDVREGTPDAHTRRHCRPRRHIALPSDHPDSRRNADGRPPRDPELIYRSAP